MKYLPHLFENNRAWVARMTRDDPTFFSRLAAQQAPEYLWIGCADSRVPANEITGLLPGELFVHRNVANLVPADDANCQSVLQYAVAVLRVRHVIVCGHYGCGGVAAAMSAPPDGHIGDWLAPLCDLRRAHAAELAALPTDARRVDRLCELNVTAQATHVARSAVVREAWRQGRPLAVHGWIYAIHDGRLRDLGVHFAAPGDLPPTGG